MRKRAITRPRKGRRPRKPRTRFLQQLTKRRRRRLRLARKFARRRHRHRYLYRLTARAHRAIEALDRLEDTTKALSGAQANSIIMEIEHARMQLTADPRERIRLLERDIEERQKQIDELKHSDTLDKLTSATGRRHHRRHPQHAARRADRPARTGARGTRQRRQSAPKHAGRRSISVEQALGAYHDEYHRSFHESDSGRRFEDAFQVIVTDEGRREIDEAVRDIAQNPYLEGEPGVLLAQVARRTQTHLRGHRGRAPADPHIRRGGEPSGAPADRHALPHHARQAPPDCSRRTSDDAKTHARARTTTHTVRTPARRNSRHCRPRPAKSMARAATAGSGRRAFDDRRRART
ncbi:MAG: DUF3375 family protein [Bifidobacterium adolescentis]